MPMALSFELPKKQSYIPNRTSLKKLRHILNATIWIIFGTYLTVSILLHIPAIQRYTGECAANILQDKFGTKVSIKSINLGFLNRIIIDDFEMNDQQDKQMLNASRLSVSIDIIELTKGRISISSAQVFGMKANIYKAKASDKLNCQFVIDSLSSESKSESKLDLCINSFIIRNGAICYNQYDKPRTPNLFNEYHISLSDISSNIIVRRIKDGMIDATIKKLAFNEASGLSLKDLTLNLYADKGKAKVSNFTLKLPHSIFSSDSITTSCKSTNGSINPKEILLHGHLYGKDIFLGDFAFLNNTLKDIHTTFNMNTSFACSNGNITANRIELYSADKDMRLSAQGHIKPFGTTKEWAIQLKELHIGTHCLAMINKVLSATKTNIPPQLAYIKTFSIRGNASGKGSDIIANSHISTNLGDIDAKLNKKGSKAYASVSTKDLYIKDIIADNRFGSVALGINATGNIRANKLEDINVKGNIARLDFNNYSFKNITVDGNYARDAISGTLSLNDPNCEISINGSVRNIHSLPTAELKASIAKLYPHRLNISNKWGDASFHANIYANATGNSISNLCGKLTVDDFRLLSPTEDYTISNLEASMSPRQLTVQSDFGKIDIEGAYNFQTLKESILGILKDKLPTMPGLERTVYRAENNFRLNADITDTKWLQILFGVPFHAIKPIHLTARIDDSKRFVAANVDMQDFIYNNERYKSGNVLITTRKDTLYTNAQINKILEGNNNIQLCLNTSAAGNRLNSALHFDYNTPTRIKGTLLTQAQFYKDKNKNNTIEQAVDPSTMMINDTAWYICPANIIYNDERIEVNHFAIERGKQHIRIDGLATHSPSDSICVDLKDVDVDYILNLVNFHSVTFNGLASGKAYLKSVLNSPDAYADLTVDQFKFQDGRMGTLYANVKWNKEDKQIDIDAHADDADNAQTIIKGYVSPARNYIDLGITAKDTNIEFLESFCGSFMEDINGHANGFAQVYGDLSEVNLRGLLVADGSLKITPLNTVYHLQNDTIRMIPNEIIFDGDTVTDRNGNIATITGALHHKNLTRLTYDLNINTNNFLCYDTGGYGNNTFYGTVYGTGSCTITGRPHNIRFDVDLTPHKGSFIEYDASSPDAITNRDFITWLDKDGSDDNSTVDDSLHTELRTQTNLNDASDMHINVNVNTTPDFTLRILMDKTSGDKISLNGSGTIKAAYFNKGSFDMFGTYLIDHGAYNLTIQNIIKKDFQFQQGSSIVFGGNPFNAQLNLKAVYPVNGVSLADLKIGNSFSSNNVRVDCIMNIGGTPEAIRVDFDFDMPTVNNDAKQMVRSLINSEEEMNQQVVYLLAIGRFYTDTKNNSTQEDAQQSQTSLAMQSLLSGTISQQVNNILGTLINNNNWNFGTNISTGTEGFNNAEYEGLLSGRLFSNRLLINGQFGYRDNPNTTSSFIGDFDVKYLLTPSGNVAIKVYNQTNDRYFTKSSLNTQGLGIILKRDFINWKDLFKTKKKLYNSPKADKE